MITSKFHTMLYARINNTLAEWSEREHIPESMMYEFLHMLQGTAGTVGLPIISELAAEKLKDLNDHSTRQWPRTEWQAYMNPFREIAELGEKTLHGTENVAVSREKLPAPSPAHFILLIDDDHDFVAFLKEILEEYGYNVSIALTAERGLELYYQLRPDWIAIDVHLPDQNGFELLKQIVAKAKKENTPVAIISSEDTKENRLLTYSIGALDFIPKPIDHEVLNAYLRNRLTYKREIESTIIIDELTGAFNRKHFNTMLQFFLSAYKRDGQAFCLVMLDLDLFKQVNDIHGHLKGDEVLQEFVGIAQQVKRETDMLFRYGGEEFALILPNTTSELAQEMIGRFRNALARHRFESAQGSFQTTFSAGLIQAAPQYHNREEMVDKADKALYHAKQNGRNQTIAYQGDLSGELLAIKPQSRLHIIIVDDIFIVREILSSHFQEWTPASGIPVIVSQYADGESFLQSKWYHPDDQHVILLDGMLPNMDGIDVLKNIRGTYSNHNVIVTMLTARGGEFDVVRAIEYGADDYIIKPFQVEDVSARLQQLMSRRFN